MASAEDIAINGHSIRKLKITSDPKKPIAGVATELLTVAFTLRSRSGISTSRIKVLINNGSVSLSSNNFTTFERIAVDDNNDNVEDENVEAYLVEIKKEGLIFLKTENLIKVQYLLSSITPNSVQAQEEKQFFIRPSNNNSGGGNSGGGSGGGNNGNGNGSFAEIPRLITLNLEVDNGETMVSNENKIFRLTIDQDQRLLDTVTSDTFNAKTNPVLKNLTITRIDPDTKKKIGKVTDDFEFSLEQGSVAVTDSVSNGQILRTIYTSNQVIRERQNLKFVINLRKFYENSGVKLEDNIVTFDKDTIKITAQEINGTNLAVDDPINFSLISSGKSKVNYQSDEFNLSGDFSLENGGIASVSTVNFYVEAKKNKLTKPKIKGSKKISIKPKLTESGTNFTNSGGSSYTLTMPLQMSISSSKANLNKGGFFDSAVTKTVTIPFSIIGKSTDNLDILLKGTFEGSPTLNFEALPTEASEEPVPGI